MAAAVLNQRIPGEVPLHQEAPPSSNMLNTAFSIASVVGVLFSILSGKVWLAILPGAYLVYQAFQYLLSPNAENASTILRAMGEGVARYAMETRGDNGLRGGGGRESYRPGGHQEGPRAPVGGGHTNTPGNLPRGGHQEGPRAPVGHGHTDTPGILNRGGPQEGARAPVGHGHRPPGEEPQARQPGPQPGQRAPVGRI